MNTMPTNHERLILQLKRRLRVCEEATRAMIEDLKKAGTTHWTFEAIENEREEFLDTVRLCLGHVPDPDKCQACKLHWTYCRGLCKECYEPVDPG